MFQSISARFFMLSVLLCSAGFASAASVDQFITPSGGEVYLVGRKQQVRIAMGTFKADVLIEISTDGGKTYSSLGTVSAPSKTTREFVLDYTVPGPATASAILRASSTSAKTPTPILSQIFTITSADISGGVQVQAGAVDSAQLADGSVSTNKLAASAVTAPKLADGAVTVAKLSDSSVTTTKLVDGSITAVKIAPKTITPDKLSSQSASSGFVLTSDGIGGAQYLPVPSATFVLPGSVTNSSVADTAGISYSKLNLSNSIVGSDIKDGSIFDADISATAGIQYSKLNLTNSIVSGDIKDGSIIDADINVNAGIQYSKLSLTNSIVGGDIKAGAIVDSNVAANAAIKYSKLNLFGSISTSDIVAGAIIDSSISPSAAISYSKLKLQGSIVSSDLKDGEITNAKINANAGIAYSKLNLANSIVGSDFAPGAITLDKINTSTATAVGQVLTFDGTNLIFSSAATGFSVPALKNVNSSSNLLDITNSGDGSAGSFSISSSTSNASALIGKSSGFGDGVFGQSLLGVAVHGRKASNETGMAGYFENNNTTDNSTALAAQQVGPGLAFQAINNGTGSVASFESNNAGNSVAALKVKHAGSGVGLTVDLTALTSAANAATITHAGIGEGLEINLSNAANAAAGLKVAHMGTGDGIVSSSTGGNGITGIANIAQTAGVEGDNTADAPGVYGYSSTVSWGATTGLNYGAGPGILGVTGSNSIYGGAVEGNNFGAGPGILGYSQGDLGVGVYALAGVKQNNSTAARFENLLDSNTANTVEIKSNSAAPHLAVTSTAAAPAQGVTIAMPATAASAGSTALQVTNGAIALSATKDYVTGAPVDNAYQIVTTAGDFTLPTAAPLQDGATTWVINNSANPSGPVNVTNTTAGTVVIAPGNAKQFLFVKAVSASNWIPVQ